LRRARRPRWISQFFLHALRRLLLFRGKADFGAAPTRDEGARTRGLGEALNQSKLVV
jgi:hypothetical protein